MKKSTRKELVEAVQDVMGTLNYYIGPAARSAVSRNSRAKYDRLTAALAAEKEEGENHDRN